MIFFLFSKKNTRTAKQPRHFITTIILVFYLTYTDDPVTIPTAKELQAMEHSLDVSALGSPKKTPPIRVVPFW